MAVVKLSNVRKSFGSVDVIRGIDLDIADGEFIVFVGPSGCGKSTLLRMVAGLEDISSGAVAIDGAVVNDLPPADRQIAMVFQSYALYPHKTVRENMSFGLRMAKVDRATIQRKVQEAARTLELEHLLDRKPKELSGGQRQRVAIGRAIVRNPRLFLFDEPLSNLDAALRSQMRLEIARLHQRLGATMIYVTHDQVEAMTLAERIVVLNGGRVEQVGSPMDLYNHPQNLFVAGFIGSPKMNFLRGEVIEKHENVARVSFAGGTTFDCPVFDAAALSAGAPVTVGVRSEDCLNATDEIVLDVEAQVVEPLGAETHVLSQIATGEMLVVSLDGRTPIKVGHRIQIGVSISRLHLFDEGGAAIESPHRHCHAPAPNELRKSR